MKRVSTDKIISIAFSLLLASICLNGCNRSNSNSKSPVKSITTSNKATNEIAHKIKIASFAPSNTELIYSLGAQDCLVGTSTECKYPKDAMTNPKIGSFIAAKYEKLAALKPDLALLVSGQESLEAQLKRRNYSTRLLENNKLKDIAVNLKYLGTICKKTEKANYLTSQFDAALLELQQILSKKKSPSILFCIWLNPTMCIGGKGFLNDVITVCGATNCAKSFNTCYPKLTAEKIISTNPQFVILPFEAQRENISSRPPWSSLNAVKSSKLFYLPEAKYDQLSRPTLRIVSGLHWLAIRLHPEESQRLNAWLSKYEPKMIKEK